MRGQVRSLHLRVRSRVSIPGHGHRLSFGPCHGFTGRGVESLVQARRADQFGAVDVSQRPVMNDRDLSRLATRHRNAAGDSAARCGRQRSGQVIPAYLAARARSAAIARARDGECGAGDEPVQQFVLRCAREPVDEHLVPRGEVVCSFPAPVPGLIEGSVYGARPPGSARPAASSASR